MTPETGHAYPDDLFIPPDALLVLMESFSGPLDLLLYLIRRQKIDILDIPMVTITEQYLEYIQLLETHRLSLAADYLVMAAVLIEIKSRMLLPVIPSMDEEEILDPRLALVRQLQCYEYYKERAEALDSLPRLERDFEMVQVKPSPMAQTIHHPEVVLMDVLEAMTRVSQREGHRENHSVTAEQLSLRERMSAILDRLNESILVEFSTLFTYAEGRMGLVVSLLASLELSRQALLIIIQPSLFAAITLKARTDGD